MFQSDPASSRRANAILARILYLLHAGGAVEAARRHIELYLGGPCTISDFAPNRVTPRMTLAWIGNRFLLLLGGVPNAEVAGRLVSGYMFSGFAASEFGVHPLAEEFFGNEKAYLDASFPTTTVYSITLAGYSYGGAMASSIAPYLTNRNPNASVKCVTFGAPRIWSTSADTRSPGDFSAWRLMNVRDPIPLLPPHIYEWSPGYQFAPTAVRNRMNSWDHYGGGEILDTVAEPVNAVVPNSTCIGSTVSLLGWATGILVDPTIEHNIGTYAQRLEKFLPADPANVGPADPPQAAEVPAWMPTHTQPFPPRADVDGNFPVRLRERLENPAGGPGDKPYYVVKLNGTWSVWYMRTMLCPCKGRRQALKICRDFNQIVTQVETVVGADPDAMGGSIIEHFLGG